MSRLHEEPDLLRRKSASPESSVSAASVLASGSRTNGRWESDDDVILAGFFEGQLRSSRSVQLLTGSSVSGDVHAAEIVVQGKVTGNLLARERIRILVGGSVNGDVCAPQVTVQEGVAINGRIRMLGTDQDTRDYLLPVLLRATDVSTRGWQALLDGCDEFMDHHGFHAETRAKPGPLMRCIFRTREPITYAAFLQRLDAIDDALQQASRQASKSAQAVSAGRRPEPAILPAQQLITTLGDAAGTIGIFGSTAVRVVDAANGSVQRTIQRPAALPPVGQVDNPKPGDLLLDLQRIHVDLLGETARLDRVAKS
jgi:cytoskeletal protein CcmA (bactofilin family)